MSCRWNQPTALDRNLLILKHDAVLATHSEGLDARRERANVRTFRMSGSGTDIVSATPKVDLARRIVPNDPQRSSSAECLEDDAEREIEQHDAYFEDAHPRIVKGVELVAG